MNIPINSSVVYDVASVKITNIILLKGHGGSLRVMAPYVWLDSQGKEIRRGTNSYTEAQLAPLGQDAINLMKSLVPTEGTSGNCTIVLKDDGTVVAGRGYSGVVNGVPAWINTPINAVDFAALIAPVTVEQLKQMVAGFTATVFA
jgi:hypothetical protein